jgi:hypothetical protein
VWECSIGPNCIRVLVKPVSAYVCLERFYPDIEPIKF